MHQEYGWDTSREAPLVKAAYVLPFIAPGLVEAPALPTVVRAQESVSDAQGNIHIPSNYRTKYEFLGTWAIADTSGKFPKQMHKAYASPGTIAAYGRDGHFPDGTVLVKELFATETQSMTTGNGRHAQSCSAGSTS